MSALRAKADAPKSDSYVRYAPCVDGSLLARDFLIVFTCWSERPCVRPVSAAFGIAAGHNALREPWSQPKARASIAPGANWGVLVRGPTGVGALSDHRPFQHSIATRVAPRVSCVRRPLAAPRCNPLHAPSAPTRSARSCWPGRPRRSWACAGREGSRARDVFPVHGSSRA